MKWFNRVLPVLLFGLLVGCQSDASYDTEESADAEDATEAGYDGPNAVLIADLMETQSALMERIHSASPDQWTFREIDERWNTAEVVEHLVIAENMFYGFLTGEVFTAEPADVAEADMSEADAGVAMFIRDRSTSFQAPPPAQPTGMYTSPEDAAAAFNEARDRTIEFLSTTELDLRAYSASLPAAEDSPPMDGHQWFLFISGHTARHTAQIDQITEDEAYPSGS